MQREENEDQKVASKVGAPKNILKTLALLYEIKTRGVLFILQAHWALAIAT